eukprot:GCRY01000312.1.p1 GENE.GCRY01000312.1~~GCRY01000312.1.p1  ORF type:complete len:440 (+),score=66.82 GCRY01000312.1:202-1521(+)
MKLFGKGSVNNDSNQEVNEEYGLLGTKVAKSSPFSQFTLRVLLVLSCFAILVCMIVLSCKSDDWRKPSLAAIGLFQGFVLYSGRLSFTAFFRRVFTNGDISGMLAMVFMFALTMIFYVPFLHHGEFDHHILVGSVYPIGIALTLGAFIFTVGMQLAGGCASGVLYTLGGGSLSHVTAFLGFIVGSVIGAAHWGDYSQWTKSEGYSFTEHDRKSTTPFVGILLQLLLLLLYVVLLLFITIYRFYDIHSLKGSLARLFFVIRSKTGGLTKGPCNWIKGSMSVWEAVFFLSLLNVFTLWAKGSAWGITSAYAVLGGQFLQWIGIEVKNWDYWAVHDLNQPLFDNWMWIQDLAVIAGALVAALAAGRFANDGVGRFSHHLSALVGGVFLGYGARMSGGCNIGGLYAGFASSSAHAWVWLGAGLLGTILGLLFRPVCGRRNEKR